MEAAAKTGCAAAEQADLALDVQAAADAAG